MSKYFTINEYITEIEAYRDLSLALAGKPQKLTVAGDYFYWTQGKEQKLYRVSKNKLGEIAQPVIIEASTLSDKNDEKLDKEEELLRERTRSITTGISSFRVREADHTIFYSVGMELFIYYTQGPRAHKEPLKVFSYLSEADKACYKGTLATHPNLCAQFVGNAAGSGEKSFSTFTFVNQNNLYMAYLTEHPEDDAAPLTLSVVQVTTIGDEAHPCGVADYIIQEEFSRYTGHYASEDYIIFSYIDSTIMRQVALLKGDTEEMEAGDEGIERMPYSRVGDPNTRTTIVVYECQTRTMRYVPAESLHQVGVEDGVEYIPRFGFKGNADIYLFLLNRTQEHGVVVSCPIASLPRIDEVALQRLYTTQAASAVEEREKAEVKKATDEASGVAFTLEWSQRIPWAWVEVFPGDPIYFGAAYDLTLCAAAETPTAHAHLYIRPSGTGAAGWRPLTCGAWNVAGGSVKVHEDCVSFIANAGGLLTSTLYSVPLLKGAEKGPKDTSTLTRHTPLTEHVYPSYEIHKGELFYCTSTLTRPAILFGTTVEAGDDSARRVAQPASWISDPSSFSSSCQHTGEVGLFPSSVSLWGCQLVIPEVVTVPNRHGVPLNAHVFVPVFDEKKEAAAATAGEGPLPSHSSSSLLPLALFIYGGPHAQLVNGANFDEVVRPSLQVLLRHGIAVAVVDNVMSNANGLREHAVCKRNMGHFETADYVDFVNFLCARKGSPRFDVTRVAIFGWSYGGYATLLAMAQAPEVFRIGLAGAPVGDWRLYDTAYTERYMGLLHSNPASNDDDNERAAGATSEAYGKSSIEYFAKGFPDELHRVYIAHGLLDENVHFTHTCHVVNAMINEGKPYHMLVYPGERHGLRKRQRCRLHHEAILIKTIVEGLQN